jgi:predicted polyphosphate/ATP-dependent NAD kinase
MIAGNHSEVKKLGLIVNPIAGIGGRVGLKGSDGLEIQERAFALGAVSESQNRVIQALERIKPIQDKIELITFPGEMGADAARIGGFEPFIIGEIVPGRTTAEDTRLAAKEMLEQNTDLLLFAGGDGTARDIYQAVGDRLPVLGIPAGVKIHSAVYARNPRSAGDLAVSYLNGETSTLQLAEVMDTDEGAFRQGELSARLYGYLKIPFQRRLLQSLKSGSATGEQEALDAIAYDVVDNLQDGWLYILGPGTTTRAITTVLGLEKTLLGVDVLKDRQIIASDANEYRLLELIEGHKAKIVITPIGGQGFLFGRGNQQISPEVIRKVGIDNIMVISTKEKIRSLRGEPLILDTGDREIDKMFSGYVRVITGYKERSVYRVSS